VITRDRDGRSPSVCLTVLEVGTACIFRTEVSRSVRHQRVHQRSELGVQPHFGMDVRMALRMGLGMGVQTGTTRALDAAIQKT
jgi:hypothetical protein